MNQGRFLTRSARYWPQRPAILFHDRVITYRELDERSSRLANALIALGAQKGDRVLVQSFNRPELIEFECAMYKAGLVKVALNARLSPEETVESANSSQAKIMLVGPEHVATIVQQAGRLTDIRTLVALVNGPHGRTRLPLDRRSQEGDDHLRRLQRVPQ